MYRTYGQSKHLRQGKPALAEAINTLRKETALRKYAEHALKQALGRLAAQIQITKRAREEADYFQRAALEENAM